MQTKLMSRANHAFTLVEVLVVIGIIALLISILMPALSHARAQAKMIACMSNLRQIGMGCTMYANDNRQWLPAATATGSGAGWWKVEISPYIRRPVDWTPMIKDAYWGAKGPFGCPSWQGVSPACQVYVDAYPGMFGGLVWSNSISYRGDTQRAKFSKFKKSEEESALVGDGVDISQYVEPVKTNYYNYLYLYPIGTYPVDMRIARRHNKGLNILWADMHVDNKSQAFMAAGKNNNTGWYYNTH